MKIKRILLLFTLLTLCFSKAAENEKLITVHAEDANLSTILAILAQESGYNIVTGPMVNQEDRLTIHIDKTPVKQAINLVVRASGLSYEIVGNSILVAQKEKLAEEIGIKLITSKLIVYAIPITEDNNEKKGIYASIDSINTEKYKIMQLSGTKQRELLRN